MQKFQGIPFMYKNVIHPDIKITYADIYIYIYILERLCGVNKE
jgi:hypothetical protein